jgi:UDP-2,4-diacetamido-2,4,6-trideoxy-beta-L-altropyranose hydrolase
MDYLVTGNDMRIIFRVDSSLQIGTGHLQRCITLAHKLIQEGAIISFICRDLPGNAIFLLKKYHFSVKILSHSAPLLEDYSTQCTHQAFLQVSQQVDLNQTLEAIGSEKIDWLIVDHYALDAFWEKQLKTKCSRILVIDDLADRAHDCDLLLDQNYYPNPTIRYHSLIPKQCHQLSGPHYSLLRNEFSILHEKINRKIKKIERITVFFGGSDFNNATEKTLNALKKINLNKIQIHALIGVLNPWIETIKNIVLNEKNFFLHTYMDSMAEWLASSDLAIGAGGATLLERCCLGVPSLVLSCAANQEKIAEIAAHKGLIYYLGPDLIINEKAIINATQQCIEHPIDLKKMSLKGMALVDGKGAFRVTQYLLK